MLLHLRLVVSTLRRAGTARRDQDWIDLVRSADWQRFGDTGTPPAEPIEHCEIQMYDAPWGDNGTQSKGLNQTKAWCSSK